MRREQGLQAREGLWKGVQTAKTKDPDLKAVSVDQKIFKNMAQTKSESKRPKSCLASLRMTQTKTVMITKVSTMNFKRSTTSKTF